MHAAWFRTNVLHACVPGFGRGRDGMYRRTVRGEERIANELRLKLGIQVSW
jgi:hypothetical protein